MKALREGSLKVTAGDWPTFMYNESKYNPEDKEKGLLRGYTVVRVSTIIPQYYNFTNPVFRHLDMSTQAPVLLCRPGLVKERS